MPIANVNGIEIHYSLEGDGPETVVLVNGLADDLDTWMFQVDDLLAAGYRVLRFDNRGIGKSSGPTGPYTTELFACDTKALVDHLQVDRFHIMGVSMGGMIAQEFALRYPENLFTATFACTYASPGPFCSRMFAMWAAIAPVMGVPFVMKDVTLWAFTTEFFETHEDDLKEFETAMAFMSQPVHAYLAQLYAIQHHDTRDRLSELRVPTLVLAGEADILIPTYLSKELSSLIVSSEYRETPGGHACLWEHPQSFNETFIDFLKSHKGAKEL
jgi:pimeloyl-ACP methyl ester carboxylesterase